MNYGVKLYRHKLHIVHQREKPEPHRQYVELMSGVQASTRERNQSFHRDFRKITLFSNGRRHYLLVADIIFCRAEGNYTRLYYRFDAGSEKADRIESLFVSKSLKSIVSLISSDQFIRSHQSYLTNRKYIKDYHPRRGLPLNTPIETYIPVSRRNKKLVVQLIASAVN